jgi:hypothetical protein
MEELLTASTIRVRTGIGCPDKLPRHEAGQCPRRMWDLAGDFWP